jgi:hypothetical protein
MHFMAAEAIQFNLRGIFDPLKESQFQEFLSYTISRDKPLSFHEFQRNVGISRRQWDSFREMNTEAELNWVIE